MKTDYVARETLRIIIAALTPQNALAMETAAATGLRIGDVLSLETAKLIAAEPSRRLTIREQKTGKPRRLTLPAPLYARLRAIAGPKYVFTGRLSNERHRTRQAVWKDVKRAVRLFRVRGVNVAPHTARKLWAVEQLRRTGDLEQVQRKMNHKDPAITMLYALADQLTRVSRSRLKKRGPDPGPHHGPD